MAPAAWFAALGRSAGIAAGLDRYVSRSSVIAGEADTTAAQPLIKRKKRILKNDDIHPVVDIYRL